MITTLYHIGKEGYDNLPNSNNIVVEMKMAVNGEIFDQSVVIPNYRDIELKILMDEIDTSCRKVSRSYAAVFARRHDLYG